MMDPFTFGILVFVITGTILHDHCTYYSTDARVARSLAIKAKEESITAQISMKAAEQEHTYNLAMEDKKREEFLVHSQQEREEFIVHSQQEREMKLIESLTDKMSTQMVSLNANHMSVFEEQSKINTQALIALGEQFEKTSYIQLELLKTLGKMQERMDKLEATVHHNPVSSQYPSVYSDSNDSGSTFYQTVTTLS